MKHKDFIIIIFFVFFQRIINFDKFILNQYPEEILNLEPGSKLPTYDDENYFYIPILHTNDIHGSFYPKKILLPSGKSY